MSTTEPIEFKPVDRVEIKHGPLLTRGKKPVIYTGPCPLDGKTDETNIRKCEGRRIEIKGRVFIIRGVETYAKLPPPSLGEGIGILVDEAWVAISDEWEVSFGAYQYQCANCHLVYNKVNDGTWSEEKAKEEHDAMFPYQSLETSVTVCDDCFKEMKAWHEEKTALN